MTGFEPVTLILAKDIQFYHILAVRGCDIGVFKACNPSVEFAPTLNQIA